MNKEAICLIILLIATRNLVAQKTDKVFLTNGDILTGEIKGMKLAILEFNMDGPGTINIKWENVKAIRSDKVFEMMSRWGGIEVVAPDSAYFATHFFALDDIVEMTTIKDKFLRRLSGDINLGFNYTKSSQLVQFNLGSTLAYRIPKLEVGLAVNSILTHSSTDTILKKKQDISLSGTKYLNRRLFLAGTLAWQQNTELGLANRYLFNGGVGKLLISDNHNRLLAAGGLSVNREQSLETGTYLGNLDALALFKYKRFYYSTPKLSIDVGLNVYPGLSNWGRVRTEFNLQTSIELFTDFLIGLSLYDNFDNRPPEGAASKNDYGIVFTLGYKFGK